MGQKIGSDSLSVNDNPTLPWANGSFAFDGEGVPALRKTIIQKGVLKSYLHDSYTAGKDGIKSTGNSSRGGSMWSFRRPPSISSTNLVVSPGGASLDNMIEDTGKGVYFRFTFDYPNLATGEFSGLMMESYLIERGELGPSISQASIGMNLIDMLKAVDLVGKDARDAYGVRTPALRISKAKIAGSG
jgi:PmbA protein